MAGEVATIQNNAISKVDSLLNDVRALKSSVDNAILGLSFSFPGEVTVEPAQSITLLTDLVDRIQNAASDMDAVPAPEVTTEYGAMPEEPEAPQNPAPLGQMTTAAPVGNFTASKPSVSTAAFNGTVPSMGSFNPNYTPASMLSINLPADPSIDNVILNDVSYISVPAYDVPPLDYLELNEEALLAKTFDWSERPYESELLTEIKSKLLNDLSEGTYGIEPSIEAELWSRETDREMLAANAAMEALNAVAAARGSMMPPGTVAAGQSAISMALASNLSNASRDIAIKRADMYIEGRKFAFQMSKEVESMLITYWGYMQERSLKAAQLTVEVAINVYNAVASIYNIRVQAYRTAIEAYSAKVDALMKPYERDKLLMQHAKVRNEVNAGRIAVFEAKIKAEMSKVETNRMLIEEAKAKFEASLAPLQVFKARVEAFMASVEAYKGQMSANQAVMGVYKTEVDAYTARVGAYSEQVRANSLEFDAKYKATMAPLEVSKVKWDAYKTQVEAWSEAVRAAGDKNRVTLETYKSKLEALSSQIGGFSRAAESAARSISAELDNSRLLVEAQKTNVELAGRFMLERAQMSMGGAVGAMNSLNTAVGQFAGAASGIAASIAQG